MDGAFSLAQHGPLGRFDAPVEAEYKAWLVQRLRPLAIAMGSASALLWFFIAPLSHQLLTADPAVLVYLICWGVNVPALVVGIAYWRRPEPKSAIAVGTGLLLLTSLDTIVLLLPTFSGLDPIMYALAAVFFAFLGPMVQLPFRQTLAIAALVSSSGILGTLLSADESAVSQETVILASTVIVMSTLFVGPAMSFANERDLRARFLGEKTIAHQRTLIRRYAPSSVVSRIEQGDSTVDHPQRRKVTVFFSDVVGFTSLADRVDPEALADIVNDYLGELSELIERHGGTLNEFAGDGVMAIFGAPGELDPADQVQAALAAAQELQLSLPTWSQSWYQHGIIEDARARVGINTGTVSVGTFGSTVRATYTGIGLQTNIAARVQAEAPPGGILLSNTSWHLIKDTVLCEPRGEVMVKGVHFPIELYAPL